MYTFETRFSFQNLNKILTLWGSATPPNNPGVGECYLDTSQTPAKLKRWNGTAWEVISFPTASETLSLIKTVDGYGSGLNADQVRECIFQGGVVTAAYRTATATVVTFPYAFSAVAIVICSGGPDTTAGLWTGATVRTVTTTSFSVVQTNSTASPVSWLAWGRS